MVTATNQTEKRLQAEARDGDYLYDDDGKNNDAKQGQLLKTETEAQQPPQKLASIAQVFSFGKPFETKLLLLLGAVCAAIAGLVAVGMIFFLTESYTDLSADPTTNGASVRCERLPTLGTPCQTVKPLIIILFHVCCYCTSIMFVIFYVLYVCFMFYYCFEYIIYCCYVYVMYMCCILCCYICVILLCYILCYMFILLLCYVLCLSQGDLFAPPFFPVLLLLTNY